MSEHVITIGKEQTELLANMAASNSMRYRQIKSTIKDCKWSDGIKNSYEDSIDKLDALEKMLRGAESVTITHRVGDHEQ